MSEKVSQSRRRLRLGRGAFVVVFILLLLNRPVLQSYPEIMQVSFWLGLVFIVVGGMGRFYTMAFIAGMKNKTVVDYGPFSLCRNPLYFFTLCGVAGIGLMTGSLLLTLFMLLMFGITHFPQIKHEETVLLSRFGDLYRNYRAKTPGFIPDLSLYQAPEEISIKPKVLNKAMRDASVWFACIPAIALLNMAKTTGIIEPVISLF